MNVNSGLNVFYKRSYLVPVFDTYLYGVVPNAGRLSGSATASSPPPMASVPVKRSVEEVNDAEPAKKRIAALNDPLGAQLPTMEGGPPSSSRTQRGKTFGEVVPIPYGLVGLISRIQAETGCKVQVAPANGGGKDRPCYLEGTKQAIERAKNLIADMISSNGHEIEIASSGPGPSKPTNGHASIEMVIPGAKISLVIGKEGETIRSLQDKSGTKMFILQDYMLEESDKTLRIVGHPDLVDNAMQLVIDLIHKSPPSPESKKPDNQMKIGDKVQFDPISSNLEDTDERCVIITGKRTEKLVETALHGDKGDNSDGQGQGDERRNGGGPAHSISRDCDKVHLPVTVGQDVMMTEAHSKAMRSINQQPKAVILNIEEESKYWFPCYECGGQKFEDLVKHRYNKHSFIRDCPFCACAEFESRGRVSEHLNMKHRIQTGLWKPAASVISNPNPENINLEQELQEMKQSQDWKIVVKTNFAVMYDESMHTPIVCVEHLTTSNLQKKYRDDDAQFYLEELLENNLCPQGFPNMKPPMHASHLAARANHTNSKEAFLNTFSMLNIVPMDPNVNRGVWYRIESHCRKLVSYWHDVVVFSGPIYDFASTIPQINPVGLYVHAPTAFFKVVVMRRFEEEPKVQAFVIENDYKPSEVFHHRATITDIAARTGLNLSNYERYAYTWDMKNESFICSKTRCYETFLSLTDVDIHKRVPHCNICGHIFDQKTDLIAHKESHPKFTCPVADCDIIDFFKHNQEVHGMERPFQCQEEGCNLKFKRKGNFDDHFLRLHTAEREFICKYPRCTKAFSLEKHLTAHVKTVHTNQREFVCQIGQCKKKYKEKKHLQRHIKTNHGEEPSFICPYSNCGKEYKYKAGLQRHLKNSHGGKSKPDPEKRTTNHETRIGKENPTSNSTMKVARSGISKRKYVDETDEEI
ncbi:unnamed protein product [Orchesella dallaii]|uniref:C2H2-type domain-containing protein n=1 Tax=Orchesella dallaii TaxID=48710 RepID=A0ABP1PZ30_9HEXA